MLAPTKKQDLFDTVLPHSVLASFNLAVALRTSGGTLTASLQCAAIGLGLPSAWAGAGLPEYPNNHVRDLFAFALHRTRGTPAFDGLPFRPRLLHTSPPWSNSGTPATS